MMIYDDLPINIQKLIDISAGSYEKLLRPMVGFTSFPRVGFPWAEDGRLTDDNFLAFVEQFAQD